MNAQEMKQNYLSWLSNNERYKNLNERVVRIDTPFLDNGADNIIMYAENVSDSKIILNDDGWTLDYLETHGVTFRKGSNRRTILDSILSMYGLELKNDEIRLSVTPKKFAFAKQRMLQGLIQVNDLIYLKDSTVINTFKKDIFNRLDENKVFYDNPYTLIGHNGYTYTFDFSIPGLNGHKKLVKAISRPNDISRSRLFAMDAQLSQKAEPGAGFYAILNDSNKIDRIDEIKDLFLNESYVHITPILMSDKKLFSEQLINK
ncbi:DUF1828 domain-containing protein [Ligilactobacillus pobuzihii]|uniref:DUF1828 domain-containing protein n=1 Tax=Ligilactobacillus pobuzihii TaxID=449659 RepID=UPI0019CF51E2|nr:DUF1828 domain-containing protein [Ligilactobacillus pobuzihii]MBN7275554.1 DUF1828 domain-containing protein [Ligilactobacillus pobuzihii]